VRFFIDLAARPAAGQERVNGTEAYMEWETYSVDPPGISYTYVMPLDSNSFVVSACWDRRFDKLTEFIFHPQLGRDWIRAYGEVWPTFGEVLTNAMNARYGNPSLVNFADPDDGARKWHIATYVGDTPPMETYRELANYPRVAAAAQMVMTKSLALLQDLNSGAQMRAITKLKLMSKAGLASARTPVYDPSVWLSQPLRLAGR
jgi:hypothetical protein